MNGRSKQLLMCAVSALGLVGAAPLAAQAQTATAAAVDNTQEIVVTAQKRSQRLVDVPITITAYTGAYLDKVGIQDLHDLSVRTPGFYVQNQSINDPGIVMRGVTTDSTDPTDEPRVSIYQDGVSISQVPAAFTELFDEERVEVAKGPQTTLYGRSALTGAVNIIQNKAKESGFDWSVHAEGGNYNYGLIEGMVNIPLGDDLAIRFSGRIKERDGYIKNVLGGDALNGVSTKAGRIALNWRPNDRINDDLLINYEHDDPSGTAFKNKTFYPADPTTGAVLGDLSPFHSAALNGSPLLGGLGIRRTVDGATNILSWKLNDAFKLTSTSAIRHDSGYEVFDPDGFGLPVLTAKSSGHGSELSQDFRVNYDPGGKFSAFAGVSAFGDNGVQTNQLVFNEPNTLALLIGGFGGFNIGPLARSHTAPPTDATVASPANEQFDVNLGTAAFGNPIPASEVAGIAANLNPQHLETYSTQSHTEAYDVYVDGTYKLTDRLEVSGGVRYTTEDKVTKFAGMVSDRSALGAVVAALEGPGHVAGNCNNPAVQATNPSCQILLAVSQPGATSLAYTGTLPYGIQAQPTHGNGLKDRDTLSDDGASWRATARYTLAPDVNLYGTYSHGRRPETLSANGPTVPLGPSRFTVAPAETLDSYEVGIKSRQFGGRLSLDGAFYFYNYKHFQTTQLQGTSFVTSDAGNAQTYGFEGQANLIITRQIDAFVNYAYTHGRFNWGGYNGDQFRLTPQNAATIGGSWRIPALGGQFEIVPTYTYRSKVFFNDDNGRQDLQAAEGLLIPPIQFDQYQNGYGVLDLRVSYSPARGNWKIEAFGSNLGDAHYLKDAGNTGTDLGLPTYIPGEPRFYGLSFTIRH